MRRGGLLAASEREREERWSQQRDYAAQLQEQIREKNARAEQEKARRAQEIQAEREMMKTLQQQQDPQRHTTDSPQASTVAPASPARSPRRAAAQSIGESKVNAHESEIQHTMTTIVQAPGDLGSVLPTAIHPLSLPFSHTIAHDVSSPAPVVPTFAPGPSIFEPLLQSEQAVMAKKTRFYEEIAELQHQRRQVESWWSSRRPVVPTLHQQGPSRLSFIVQPTPSTMATLPPADEEKALEEDEMEIPSARSPRRSAVMMSGELSGLIGDSILIPMHRSRPSSPAINALKLDTEPLASERRLRRSTSPVALHARPSDTQAERAGGAASARALRHDSELLPAF